MTQRIHYHVAVDGAPPSRPAPPPGVVFRGMAGPRDDSTPASAEAPASGFNSDEAAARFFLGRLMTPATPGDRPDGPVFRSITRPDRPERVPGLRLERTKDQPATGTRLVSFTQAHRDIPVFGARAVVELRGNRELVSADAHLGEVGAVEPIPTLTASQALDRVAAHTGADLPTEAAVGAELNFFESNAHSTWHLAWLLKNVHAAPPGTDRDDSGRNLGPRPFPARFHFLVDAHDGTVLFSYSANPTLETPVKCSGVDEDGATVEFWGRKQDVRYQLSDPLRDVRTYDLDYANLSGAQVPQVPIDGTASLFGEVHRAGITAHHNATRVVDFYNDVLQRDGIDDAGMVLVSLVNCTAGDGSQEWLNACWYDKKMWYGQTRVGDRLVSMARYLDVMAHELTHGVVESTSGLVYQDQSGALNESFADIFGVVIKNWYQADRTDVRTWNWELGPGLGRGGLPLRDMSDPHRTNDPAHMSEYWYTQQDHGGVHVNSNIHNKAAHGVLTSTTEAGTPVFTSADAALLFYLAMARLAPMAGFSDARRAVLDVALTYFDGHPEQKVKLDALNQAYDRVGIV